MRILRQYFARQNGAKEPAINNVTALILQLACFQ
jgi:hypothetical protein